MKTAHCAIILTATTLIAIGACAPTPALTPAASISTPTAGSAATKIPETATLAPTTVTQARPTPTQRPTKEKVSFKSGDLTLVGYLFKPSGAGPFPGLIWNHGSEQDPDKGQQFDGVASIFVPAGYVLVAPMRRGHGEAQGPYSVDQIQQERKAKGDA